MGKTNFAEKAGFEPAKPFRGLHAFQACLFNHSSISPFAWSITKQIRWPSFVNAGANVSLFLCLMEYWSVFLMYFNK